MSKWIDTEIEGFVKTKIDTIEVKKNIIESEELDKVAPLAIQHFKEQMLKDDPIEREFYLYNNGVITLIASFPATKETEEIIYKNKDGKEIKRERLPKNRWKKSKFSYQGSCKLLLKESQANLFLSQEDSKAFGFNEKYWVYAKIVTQYDIKGKQRKYYDSIEKACNANNIDMNDETFSIDDVDIFYKVNLFQLIAKVK